VTLKAKLHSLTASQQSDPGTAARGVARVTAGVNVARHEAYRSLIARGFRTDLEGIAMQKGNEPGYNREGVYVLDDWR
jgi:hypothetical protein